MFETVVYLSIDHLNVRRRYKHVFMFFNLIHFIRYCWGPNRSRQPSSTIISTIILLVWSMYKFLICFIHTYLYLSEWLTYIFCQSIPHYFVEWTCLAVNNFFRRFYNTYFIVVYLLFVYYVEFKNGIPKVTSGYSSFTRCFISL